VETVHKLHEARPHVVDHLINGDIQLVVNTPMGPDAHREDAEIRRVAVAHRVPCITTLSGALAAAEGIAALKRGKLSLVPLQGLGVGVPTELSVPTRLELFLPRIVAATRRRISTVCA
jgi:hypothetical protein